MHNCQAEFDSKYITTSEIERRFNIGRCTLTRIRDRIPGAVKIANVTIYVRELAEPALAAYKEGRS
ncbi:regulatory protein [Hafnia phage yong3]|nr:regulatory protein [Hafnia phage yong3]